MENYALLDGNIVTSFVQCSEVDIKGFNLPYIKLDKEIIYDANYTYTIDSNNKLVIDKRKDTTYLLDNINTEFENQVSAMLATVPKSEILSWPIQEREARAYLLDMNVHTPIIDAICKARNIDKQYFVEKIIVKADAYAQSIGNLIGRRQKQEKIIVNK